MGLRMVKWKFMRNENNGSCVMKASQPLAIHKFHKKYVVFTAIFARPEQA